MDLGTVKRKLERHQYLTPHECATDIRLIWKNCQTYNAEGSDFYLLATNMSKKFEERYEQISKDCNNDMGEQEHLATNPNEMRRPTLDRKQRLGSCIFRLSGMELGHVMNLIDRFCPNALECPHGFNGDPLSNFCQSETEIEINVDLLANDSKTFQKVEDYINERMEWKKKKKVNINAISNMKTKTPVKREDAVGTRKKQKLMRSFIRSP